jgi:hypothetical protein
MKLPTFIGIGSPRSGTTWLYDLLRSHPEVFMPQLRKEINYFNLNYEKGIDWYLRFFPENEINGHYRAIGEISPHYLYCDQCPKRMADIGSIRRLVIQIRNPSTRAFSYYQLRIKNTNFTGTFKEFLDSRPETLDEGCYSKYLKNYLKLFPREQILVLVFEQMFENLEETKKKIALYLGIDPDKFPEAAGSERINQSYLPRAPKVYSVLHHYARFLRDNNLDSFVNWTKRIGFGRLFGEGKKLPKMDSDTQELLIDIYRSEKNELESLLGIDLSCWEMGIKSKSI